MKKTLLIITLIISVSEIYSQVEPLWTQDTSFVKELYIMKNKFQSLSFTGYLQVQYQKADSAGIQSFNGGDFPSYSDSRFMIRRGRFRLDFEKRTHEGFYRYNLALQFDGTERGVNIRDMFGRIYENKWNCFVLTTGVFNRPFGYELNYSSSLRESPERGRMSQILMKTERDLGAMLSFEPQDKKNRFYPLKIDAGIFNGQGLSGAGEFDSYRDFISRISLRRTKLTGNFYISGSISYLNGGFANGSDVLFRTYRGTSGNWLFISDTSATNKGEKVPRKYYGTDIQLSWDNLIGRSEIRGEYITGVQSATYSTSATPGVLPVNKLSQPEPVFERSFDGAYFYFLQTFMKKHQVILKYDWYDPNIKVKGSELNSTGYFGPADLRYNTYGAGYCYYMNENIKFVFYYDHPVNESSVAKGYTRDIPDDTYTIRIQYRF